MAEIYEIIDVLCKKKGVSGARMATDLGMSKSMMTELKKGRSKTLKLETAAKIADYFDVPIETLMGGSSETQKSPQPNEAGSDVGVLMDALKNKLKTEDMIAYNGTVLSRAAAESLLASIEATDRMTAALAESESKDKEG